MGSVPYLFKSFGVIKLYLYVMVVNTVSTKSLVYHIYHVSNISYIDDQ